MLLLGILASIALLSYSKHIDSANYAEAQAEMRAIATSVQLQLVEDSQYPSDKTPGQQPDGSETYWPNDTPYDVPFDYEHWIIARMPDGRRNCRLVMITWPGKDGKRRTPIHRALRSDKGLHKDGDDLYLIIDADDCDRSYRPGPVR